MPRPDKMSALEQIVARREGIVQKPKKKQHRLDRELDEIEAKIEQLERDWRERG